MVSVHIDTPAGVRRLTFTGDVGRMGLPILRDPEPVPPCDLLISESTYGGHTHEPVDETADKLGEVVRRTAERGGRPKRFYEVRPAGSKALEYSWTALRSMWQGLEPKRREA